MNKQENIDLYILHEVVREETRKAEKECVGKKLKKARKLTAVHFVIWFSKGLLFKGHVVHRLFSHGLYPKRVHCTAAYVAYEIA